MNSKTQVTNTPEVEKLKKRGFSISFVNSDGSKKSLSESQANKDMKMKQNIFNESASPRQVVQSLIETKPQTSRFPSTNVETRMTSNLPANSSIMSDKITGNLNRSSCSTPLMRITPMRTGQNIITENKTPVSQTKVNQALKSETTTQTIQNKMNHLPENKVSTSQARISQNISLEPKTSNSGRISSSLNSGGIETKICNIPNRITPTKSLLASFNSQVKKTSSLSVLENKTQLQNRSNNNAMQSRLAQNTSRVENKISGQARLNQNTNSSEISKSHISLQIRPSSNISDKNNQVRISLENIKQLKQSRASPNTLQDPQISNQPRHVQNLLGQPDGKFVNPSIKIQQAQELSTKTSDNLQSISTTISNTMQMSRLVTPPKRIIQSNPSPNTAKKKCIQRNFIITSEQGDKGIHSTSEINTVASSPSTEETSTNNSKFFNIPKLSPALSITPIKQSSTSLDTCMKCTSCGNLSKNLLKCDNCSQSCVQTSKLSHQIKLQEQKEGIPVVVTHKTVEKKIIIGNERVTQSESFFKQAYQKEIYLMPAPSKARPRTRRKPIEPVCLTISSDEEETMPETFTSVSEETSLNTSIIYTQESEGSKSESSPSEMHHQDIIDSDELAFPGCTDINPKFNETDMSFEEDEEEIDEEIEYPEEEELLDEEEEPEEEEIDDEEEVLPELEEEPENNEQLRNIKDTISLPCRSIRIGSYRVHSRTQENIRVIITTEGFVFRAPTITDPNKIVNISIKKSDITQVIAHFGRCLPIIFLQTSENFGENLRNILNMSKSDNQYFDPMLPDDKLRFITFLVNAFLEEQRNFFRHSFKRDIKVVEIDQKSANELLVKSTPSTNQLIVKCTAASSSVSENQSCITISPVQQSQAQQVISVKQILPTVPVTKILTYPPPPQTGGIAITSEDLACLNEGEYLNDAIIDFYLKKSTTFSLI